MNDKLLWGIISTGSIARTFARGLAESKTGRLLAIASRTAETAEAFGAEFGVERRYGSYEALLEDKDVQAVYVATPHPIHAEWAIKAADAGKHILCEKPIGMNFAEAMAIVEAARRNDVFLMEAFMYRCHPQTARLVEWLQEKAIGDVRVIQAVFSFNAGDDEEGRLLANHLGGGGILDVGCYTTSMARLVAGVAMGKEFADPIDVQAVGHLGPTGVDEWASAVLKFPGDIIAQISCGVRVTQESSVHIYGSEGHIVLPSPWIPSRTGGTTKVIVQAKGDHQPRELDVTTDEWLYAIEADYVASSIDKRQAPFPAMSWADTLGNMKTLDRWRAAIGLIYDSERPQNLKRSIHGGKLKVRPGSLMKYGEVPGLDKKVSRLVMGNMISDPIVTSAMLDDFYERGGNAIDTAYVYGGGRCEKALGWWVKNRRIRNKVVILAKGAHTPCCNPDDLTRQLCESLDRLQTDYVDLYMMHRDNPDIPVGEFVDVLNKHKRAGRMLAFGASNWTLKRFKAAQDYAAKHKLAGFSAISNNFSLAEMVDAVWEGCLSAKDPQWEAYLTKTHTPLMAWSSQARGFFTGRANPKDKSDADLARCWYSKDNFRRRERAIKLAKEKGVEPINVALAWVLHQAFPTFALIGPLTIAETRSSFAALEVELTPEEVKWLNLV